ncbi:SIS domain-containing protein [Marinimicrobium sp. ARAG 43.8]|uniref:SIS domain-containing protein n=1 Tax=Marinimicrobium sp. ARAG 43.8 TaxID=3418719 RepID=UPI003CE9C5F5
MNYLGFTEASLDELSAIWTAKEICQQPQSWLRAYEAYQTARPVVDEFLERLLRKPDLRIILTGAGTSAFAGGCLAPLMTSTLQRRAESVSTTDIVSNPMSYLEAGTPTLMVSFARSGNSPESVAAVRLADQAVKECYHLVVTCNKEGSLFQYCQDSERALAVLTPEETNDKSFAMTSSFTSMMLMAALVFCPTEISFKDLEEVSHGTRDLILDQEARLRALAQQPFERVVFLGSGGFASLAQESALKLLELTDGQVVAMHDSPLGFRHGPKTIINEHTLVFVFLSSNPYTRQYDLDLLAELRRDGEAGKVIALSADNGQLCEEDIGIGYASSLSDFLLHFPYIVCAQMFAFYKALALLNKPDSPSSGGTVNRVVQGVTIYPMYEKRKPALQEGGECI